MDTTKKAMLISALVMQIPALTIFAQSGAVRLIGLTWSFLGWMLYISTLGDSIKIAVANVMPSSRVRA